MWLALLLPSAALAENPTTVAFGCAPWDGRTLEVVVSAPDRTFRISVWGAGLTALQAGAHDVVLDNQSPSATTPDTTGRASVRPANSATPPTWTDLPGVTIHFDTLDAKEGGAASGWIAPSGPDGMKIPFAGTLGGPAPCG
ncbi:MAG: hypothetical protein H6738_11730 [Alphaproteobacteria bacterium]|nr:hypothetical protein [Alphaproteobacteria bacterium]MCB9697442.1 hypothetical protein [Alphaproteobacteria bacterium]